MERFLDGDLYDFLVWIRRKKPRIILANIVDRSKYHVTSNRHAIGCSSLVVNGGLVEAINVNGF